MKINRGNEADTEIGWDDQKNVVIFNKSDSSLKYKMELHTSYMPYFPQLFSENRLSFSEVIELLQKHHIPNRQKLEGEIAPGRKHVISVENLRKLSTSKITVHDLEIEEEYSTDSGGCSCSKTIAAHNSPPLIIIWFLLTLIFMVRYKWKRYLN